jgi:hypothetical protein
MSDTAAIILMGAFLIVGSAVAIRLLDRWDMKRREKNSMLNPAVNVTWQKRMENPDFAGLEKHFGCTLPASFRSMYQDQELINSTDLLIGVPNPLENCNESYIHRFKPADIETASRVWRGCEGLFPIANNGAGDEFMVDLRRSDPDVVYYLHETKERKALGVTLSAFLTAPRRAVPEE